MGQPSDREIKEIRSRLLEDVSSALSDAGAPTGKHSVKNAAADVINRVFSAPPKDSTSAAANEGQYYAVWLQNATGIFLDVTIYYATSNISGVQQTTHRLAPAMLDPFLLGQCPFLVGYVMVIYADGELIARLPAQGVMTPELASQMNPQDQNPCADGWGIS